MFGLALHCGQATEPYVRTQFPVTRRARVIGNSHRPYSAVGRCRCLFVVDRWLFAARRRRSEPRVGFVARRRGEPGARAALTSLASLSRAISRFRSWERRSETVTVTDPAISRRPSRVISILCCSSESASESATFHVSSTRLSEVLTCWPPGPDDRENRQLSSDAGIVSADDTFRSIHQALHNRNPVGIRVAVCAPRKLPRRTRERPRTQSGSERAQDLVRVRNRRRVHDQNPPTRRSSLSRTRAFAAPASSPTRSLDRRMP